MSEIVAYLKKMGLFEKVSELSRIIGVGVDEVSEIALELGVNSLYILNSPKYRDRIASIAKNEEISLSEASKRILNSVITTGIGLYGKIDEFLTKVSRVGVGLRIVGVEWLSDVSEIGIVALLEKKDHPTASFRIDLRRDGSIRLVCSINAGSERELGEKYIDVKNALDAVIEDVNRSEEYNAIVNEVEDCGGAISIDYCEVDDVLQIYLVLEVHSARCVPKLNELYDLLIKAKGVALGAETS
ncbi:MAG: hypothetical protein N3E36_02145 [Sulfolobales archaeon]|nr:hypothetical protein [Sulfolobales archaeon]MCX8198814.1 hypothetical protein [Sulfolobales archaeon]MDW8170788.1 hypothetical protein [Desulfurococcaceae archaeon]